MRGNIFSIELLIGAVLILSLFTIFYSQENTISSVDFSNFNLNTKQINYLYFGQDETITFDNEMCEKIVVFDNDTNNFVEKNICEEIL